MSDQRPTAFEPYPHATEAGRPSDESRPAPSALQSWAGSPPIAPAASAGPTRRGVVTGLVVGGALLFGATQLMWRADRNPDPGPSELATELPGTEPGQAQDTATFGTDPGFTVPVPSGWQVEQASENAVAISQGKNRLVAREYVAGTDASAVDEAGRMATRYASSVVRTGKPTTSKAGDGDKTLGTYRSAGTEARRKVTLQSDVAIRDPDARAVAVVTVLIDGADPQIADDLDRMRQEILDQL